MPKSSQPRFMVDWAFLALSTFHMPGIVRNGSRVGLHGRLGDYDQVNCMFAACWRMVQDRGRQSELKALEFNVPRRMFFKGFTKHIHM